MFRGGVEKPEEPQRVHRPRIHRQPVSVGFGHHDFFAQLAAQAHHIGLQAPADPLRKLLAPDVPGQRVHGYQAAGGKSQCPE